MTWLAALVVVGLAGFLTGMTGFGFSVLSVPLLLLIYPPHDVVVMALCLVPLTSALLLLTPHLRGKLDQLALCTQAGNRQKPERHDDQRHEVLQRHPVTWLDQQR